MDAAWHKESSYGTRVVRMPRDAPLCNFLMFFR
jgi:hypothetical protein